MRAFFLTDCFSVNPVACTARKDFSYREMVLTSTYVRQLCLSTLELLFWVCSQPLGKGTRLFIEALQVF